MRFLSPIIFFFFSVSLFAQPGEVKFLKTLNQNDHPQWDKTLRGVSFSVYPVMGASVGTLLGVGYYNKDEVMIRNGYKTAIALCLNEALKQGMKRSIRRERPFVTYPDDIVKRTKVSEFSFPSGHCSAAFCTATALTLSTKKWYVGVPAYSYAGFLAYSRMRLGVHYPSDILGGMIVGIGASLLTWQVDKWVNKK